MMMLKKTAVVLCLLLAACSETRQAAAPVPAPATAPQAAGPAATPQPGLNAVQVAPPAEVAAVRLALDSEGLRLFNSVSGASRLIPFGAGKDDVIRSLAMALKKQPGQQQNNAECANVFVPWDNGLSVWFRDERFVGWFVRKDGDATLATASGVKVGSTRAELDSAYSAKIVNSTLGVEFSAGALSGLLDGTGSSAKITDLWSGDTCVAR